MNIVKGACIRRYVIGIIGILFWSGAQAQIDSLLTRYRNAGNDFLKAELQLQIAWYYQTEEDYGKAIAYYREALVFSKDSSSANPVPVLRNIAFCYRELGDLDNETQILEDIVSRIRNDPQQRNLLHRTLQQLSTLHIQKKDYQRAILYNEEILGLAKSSDDYVSITQAYNNLGYIYHLLKEPGVSAEHFNKSYNTVKERNVRLSEDDRANILINFGVVNANMGSLDEAQRFFLDAYEIRKQQNNPIKIAQSLNYLATYDFIQGKTETALAQVEEAIRMLKDVSSGDEQELILSGSYKLMSEIMFRKNDLQSFKKFNDLFTRQQDQIIQKERRKNKLLVDRQLEAERTRNEIHRLLAEQEKSRLRLAQATLEQDKKEQELQLRNTELAVLKKENELKEQQYLNKELENRQMQQIVDLLRQRSMAMEQQQKIGLLEKEKQLQQMQIAARNKEIEQLEYSQLQDRRIRNYNFAISGLLLLLLSIAFKLYLYRNKKNRTLMQQNTMISRMNHEISVQNEELISINEQLNERTHELHTQNEKMEQAQQIIHDQNHKLKTYNRNLEEEVERRTREINATNNQLIESNSQMEKFTYAISHNLRAPIARLLGLINIMPYAVSEDDSKIIISRIKESSLHLDEVIRDLSMILEIRSHRQQYVESVNLQERLEKTLLSHEDTIRASSAEISVDLQVSKISTIPAYVDSILYNLISNSLKFQRPGRPCSINISTRQTGGSIILCVSDNGIGMDLMQVGNKLFGLYKRFHIESEGKGLGLYLVKSHVDALDGRIEVESAIDVGTSIRIFFPLKKISAQLNQSDNVVRN